MKRILILLLSLLMIFSFTGCHATTRSFGGEMTLELPKGEKLELITWKEDSLWYLTRPMREGEEPETYLYRESAEFGILEGTVTIIETK